MEKINTQSKDRYEVVVEGAFLKEVYIPAYGAKTITYYKDREKIYSIQYDDSAGFPVFVRMFENDICRKEFYYDVFNHGTKREKYYDANGQVYKELLIHGDNVHEKNY